MCKRVFCSFAILICFVAACLLVERGSIARGSGDRPASEYITGTFVGIGGQFAGRTSPFELIINRFTTPGEVQELNSALQSGGQDGMLNVLSKMDAGRVRLGNGVGVTANAIIQTPQGDGGSKITVLYQRNIHFFELRYGTRSEDYKFGYAEIYIRPHGGNEGTLIPAARIRIRDGNTWEVEDFGEFPARLMGLQVRGSVAPR